MAKGLTPPENFFISLQTFAEQLTAKFSAKSAGEPEDQLKSPVDQLFSAAWEHERALKIKDAEHILVCLGNPPYGRHEAANKENQAVTGGWVRYGDKSTPKAILEDFLEPVRYSFS